MSNLRPYLFIRRIFFGNHEVKNFLSPKRQELFRFNLRYCIARCVFRVVDTVSGFRRYEKRSSAPVAAQSVKSVERR